MTIKFNVLDWKNYDTIDQDHDSEDEDMDELDDDTYHFNIEAYGRTADDKSVYCKILNFTPHFYVQIPSSWGDKQLNLFTEDLREKIYPKRYKNCLISYKRKRLYNLYGFKAGKKSSYVMLVFNSEIGMKKYQWLLQKPYTCYTLYMRKHKFKLFETNILPLLRFLHIQDINASGWVELKKYKKLPSSEFNVDIAIEAIWTDVLSVKTDTSIAPLKILSYDIECTSSDDGFPQAMREGDKIIQIGSTFSLNGSEECYYKHIVTLGSCDPIDGVDVESYDTEKEVLRAWQKLIIKHDPDIITGYNIVGFDEVYIRDRSRMFNMNRPSLPDRKQFGIFGRKKNKVCGFTEMNLSSSALGDNRLKFYDLDGRVKIDLLKVVQRDYKLSAYKLDSVAEHFLSGKVRKLEKNVLTITNIKDIELNNYIKFIVNDCTFNDEEKFKVIKIDKENNQITLNKDLVIEERYKSLKWGSSKDDVKAQDIFKLQKGSSADRAIIAKYCVQDCALVNKLIARLCVITNHIGMSNVCSVPLSYLFYRGQTVKGFSLVAKFCRLHKYIIPVVKKPPDKCCGYVHQDNPLTKRFNDKWDKCTKCKRLMCSKNCKKPENHECDESMEGYEGATVFPPDVGFYKGPVAVLDYASLYPSSIIMSNLSHETYVDNPKYDNHPDYTYTEVSFNNKDGSITTCKYARKKDGSLGIVPMILDYLLKQRKATKKLLKNEKDAFKKSIYDGLQLAYKLSANSIYGLIGAPVSPIYFREIAASTTATGRKMLEFARHYMETVFPPIVMEIYAGIKEKDEDKIKKILKRELREDLHNEKFINYLKNTVERIISKCSIEPKTVYGDSVTGDTPILLRKLCINGDTSTNDKKWKIVIKTIEELSDEKSWKPYNEFKPLDKDRTDKQQSKTDYEVWTHKGWSPIKRVIRHKTEKKIYRVNTHNGVVDVTEDHSLLNSDAKIIKPKECKENETKLLTSFPTFTDDIEKKLNLTEILDRIKNYDVSKHTDKELEAFVYGFFYGNGSCDKHLTKGSYKYSWALNNQSDKLLNTLLKIVKKLYSDQTEFKILDTMTSSGIKKLVPKGNIEFMTNKYRPLFYNKDKLKTVPSCMLNGTYEERLHFFLGCYAADGDKCLKSKVKNVRFSNKGKIGSAQLHYLIK